MALSEPSEINSDAIRRSHPTSHGARASIHSWMLLVCGKIGLRFCHSFRSHLVEHDVLHWHLPASTRFGCRIRIAAKNRIHRCSEPALLAKVAGSASNDFDYSPSGAELLQNEFADECFVVLVLVTHLYLRLPTILLYGQHYVGKRSIPSIRWSVFSLPTPETPRRHFQAS